MHIFIDESGDPGKKGSRYFVLASLGIENEQDCRTIFKRLRKRQLRKTLSRIPEFKGNNTNEQIRKIVFSRIKLLSCKIHYVAIEKSESKKFPKEIYFDALELLLQSIQTDSPLQIVVDRSNICQNSPMLRRHTFMDSQASAGLQIADFIAWAIFRHFEYNDSQYFEWIRQKCKRIEKMAPMNGV